MHTSAREMLDPDAELLEHQRINELVNEFHDDEAGLRHRERVLEVQLAP